MNINNVAKQLEDIDLGPAADPMRTGKTKSWLGEYHWVSLKHQPDTEDQTATACTWALEQFGRSSSRWFEKDKKFYFKDERDMSMFILRWS